MDKLKRLLISVIVTAIALIPFWLWLVANHLLDPQGFWQKFVVVGAGVWLLGAGQLVLLFLLLFVLVAIWA